MAEESQEFRFGQIVDKFQGAPRRQIIKVWMGAAERSKNAEDELSAR